ncbi:MAG: hypothetical protein ACI87W_000170 [Halieaceae bacterium]|jgi:hypothetical protein
MKKILIALLLTLPLLAVAQDDYNYYEGSYWSVTSVDTKAGMFDAYIDDLDGLWRKQMDLMKASGKIKGYTMFSNVNARQGEPDLWLFVEWTSAGAALDTPRSEWDTMTTKRLGSIEESRERNIARGDLRTIMSNTLLRELSFS